MTAFSIRDEVGNAFLSHTKKKNMLPGRFKINALIIRRNCVARH